MSTDAWIEEHWIGEAVLPRPRRAPKLPALQVPHAPTCARGNAALAAHAQSRDSARHPGDGLSARQDGRNVVDQQARKLTLPGRRSALRRRLASSCRSTLASAEQCIDSNLAAIGDAPVAKRAANLVQFPFGMIVEPTGSSFLTAQKTGGRAHRFFACHFLAYAQGGQSDRTPKGRKRSLCNVASTEHFGGMADLLCRAPARH